METRVEIDGHRERWEGVGGGERLVCGFIGVEGERKRETNPCMSSDRERSNEWIDL